MKQNSLASLLESKRLYKLPKNQELAMFSDSHFYLLQKGYIKRYLITKEGEISVQSIYGPGQFFPLTPVIQEIINEIIPLRQDTFYYQTMTAVEIYSIEISDLKPALDTNPLLYRDLLIEAGRRFRSNIQLLNNQTLHNTRWRIAHLLIYLAEEFGQQRGDVVKIDVPLQQKDLANLLNISRETVSRTIGPMQKRNYIQLNNKGILIPSVEKLKSIYS